MSAPIISGDNAMLLFGLFAGTILCGVVMEKRGPLKGLPAPAFIFITAALATQVSILPREAGFYDLIWRYMVPLGIAIFLIRADLIEIVTRGGVAWRLAPGVDPRSDGPRSETARRGESADP